MADNEHTTPRQLCGRCLSPRKRANGADIGQCIQVAYGAAIRDGKPYTVGATAWGYKIGNFPPSHPRFQVMPNGDIYRLGYGVGQEVQHG